MAPGYRAGLIFCILGMLLIGSPVAFAGYPVSEDAVVKAVARVEPAVVNVRTVQMSALGKGEGVGSGIIISRDGWIITNAHVTRNAVKMYVTLTDGRTAKVTEWRANPMEDIAVLKVQAVNLPVAPVGDSGSLRKGQVAIAIGNPWKFSSTVTVGCISATGRSLDMRRMILRDMIQTDAAINPGNSGGALVNSKGEVIGINTVVYTGSGEEYVQGLGFAIPINRGMAIARALINRKDSSVKPWLGVTVMDVSPEMGLPVKKGVVVTGFPPHSPARSAGLKIGDCIVSLNQVPIHQATDIQKVLSHYKPGQSILLILVRGNKTYRAKVTLEGMRQ